MAMMGFLIWLVGVIIGNIIRLPYYRDHYAHGVELSKKDLLEYLLMSGIAVGYIVFPLSWFAFDLFNEFNWEQSLITVCIAGVMAPLSLWLFYRSHSDLNRQWSPSLEIREDHSLITSGVYRVLAT